MCTKQCRRQKDDMLDNTRLLTANTGCIQFRLTSNGYGSVKDIHHYVCHSGSLIMFDADEPRNYGVINESSNKTKTIIKHTDSTQKRKLPVNTREFND